MSLARVCLTTRSRSPARCARSTGWSQQIPIHSGNPETAHMFIINPFSGGGIAKLFSTHPSTEDRVARLEALARGGAPQSARPILT